MTKSHLRMSLYWIPVVAWMAVIFILSSIPGKNIPEVDVLNLDKAVHAGLYAILGLLLVRALSFSYSAAPVYKTILLAVIIAALYAASDEWHQYFISGRVPDLSDLLSDIIGSIAGTFLYMRRRRSMSGI